ncbi:MAG TPA: DinB family protein [Gemmatimonadales bacterium]|nr:DinB family protein [Gemmatimonadales bacterium]
MTTAVQSNRPETGEFDPYYARYINRVPDGDITTILEQQIRTTAATLRSIPADKAKYRYADGKWSIGEVIGHLADAERVFSYRAMRIARADETPIEGFDENAYVPAGQFDRRSLTDLITDFEAVRHATVSLARGFPPEAWTRIGTANRKAISVRALLYIAAGHERDHLLTLRERYGVGG